MFTGLITDVATLKARNYNRFTITCGYPASGITIGASIACDGCCLTVTACAPGQRGGAEFDADVSNETLSCTTLGSWRPGRRINLERPLTPRAEIGGHIVTGHVDGIAKIVDSKADGDSLRFNLRCQNDLSPLIAPKGSVALDGTSLTVNDVEGTIFEVNVIPHTISVTNWGEKRLGDGVNLEVDLLARYVARISIAMKLRST